MHGRADLLGAVLGFVAERAATAGGDRSRVVFLGDIVDRGPDSRGAMGLVVDTLRRWPASRLLLGNHDRWFREALLAPERVSDLWLVQGGQETLDSYAPHRPVRDALLEIRRSYPDHVETLEAASLIEFLGDFAFVHAGIDPDVPLEEQTERDCLWIRDPFLRHRGPLAKIVVHGHTILQPPRPVVTENRVSLDTGAYFTGVLSFAEIRSAERRLAFFATRRDGSVGPVEPVDLDRRYGTVLDRYPLLDDVYPAGG